MTPSRTPSPILNPDPVPGRGRDPVPTPSHPVPTPSHHVRPDPVPRSRPLGRDAVTGWGAEEGYSIMNQNPVSPAVVIPQGYPLEVSDTEGNTFLVVGWIRESAEDFSFQPVVVSKFDPEDDVERMIISGAYKLPFGGSDYRIPPGASS